MQWTWRYNFCWGCWWPWLEIFVGWRIITVNIIWLVLSNDRICYISWHHNTLERIDIINLAPGKSSTIWISSRTDLNVGNQRHSRIEPTRYGIIVVVAIIPGYQYLHSSPGTNYYFPLALAELQVWYLDPHSYPRAPYYYYSEVNPDYLGDY